jgi:para-nitrobenzyl esterase
VSVLLAMPEAQGLFHKAIIQSGAKLRLPSREEATETASALLAELGLSGNDVHKLTGVPSGCLLAAQMRLLKRIRKPWESHGLANFEPVVDGVTLPASPFYPAAASLGCAVPLIVGTCATESTFLTSGIPQVFDLSRERLTQLLSRIVGDHYGDVLAQYELAQPGPTPSDLFFAVTTDFMIRMKSIRLAELKSEQNAAPVYMYQLNYRTDVLGGKLRSPHTLDIPLVFRHYDRAILGGAPDRVLLSQQMSGAWAAFAHTGRPDHVLIPKWAPYDTNARRTMCFGVPSELISDPQSAERLAWSDP